MDDNTRRAIIEAIDTTPGDYFPFLKISRCKFEVVEKFIRNHKLGITISDVLGYRDMAILGSGKKGQLIAKTFMYYNCNGKAGHKIIFDGMVHASYQGTILYVEYNDGSKKEHVAWNEDCAKYYAALLEKFAAAMNGTVKKTIPDEVKQVEKVSPKRDIADEQRVVAEPLKVVAEQPKKVEKQENEPNRFVINTDVQILELPKMNKCYTKNNSEITKEELYWVFYDAIGDYLLNNDECEYSYSKKAGLYDCTIDTRLEEIGVDEWELEEVIMMFEEKIGAGSDEGDYHKFDLNTSIGQLVETYAKEFLSAERQAMPIRPYDGKETFMIVKETLWMKDGYIDVTGQIVRGALHVGDTVTLHFKNNMDAKLTVSRIIAEANIKTAVNGQFVRVIFKCTDELLNVVRGKHHPVYNKNVWYIEKNN